MVNELKRALRVLPPDPAHRIRVALAFKNQNQLDLAKALRMDPGLLSKCMNGYRNFTEAETAGLEQFFGVPASMLCPDVPRALDA